MEKRNGFAEIVIGERGAVAVIVAILASVLLGFAAFAVDLPNLYVARNELQNAADAGALAGARYLYIEGGTTVNAGANEIASAAARANTSQKASVEIESVERGNWSFETKTFTPDNSLPEVTTCEELIINAVRVRVARSATPVASFFARIFGNDGFTVTASAIAWIGYAADLPPLDYDQPIAICEQSILNNGVYSCNIGRMINSGSNTASSNTAAWTNFSQPCSTAGGSDVPDIISTACSGDGANADTVFFGAGIGGTGGQVDTALQALHDCWRNGQNDGVSIDSDGNGIPDQPWKLMLPVIDCPANNVSNCPEVRGAVEVNIVWIQEKQIADSKLDSTDPNKVPCDTIPCSMACDSSMDCVNGRWSNTDPVARTRWNDFVAAFRLQDATGQPPNPTNKAIYFKPSCTPHAPAGTSGGNNFCIRAKIPLLVK